MSKKGFFGDTGEAGHNDATGFGKGHAYGGGALPDIGYAVVAGEGAGRTGDGHGKSRGAGTSWCQTSSYGNVGDGEGYAEGTGE